MEERMTEGRAGARLLAAGSLLAVVLAAPGRGPAAGVLGKDPAGEARVVRSAGEALKVLEEALPRRAGRLLVLSQFVYVEDLMLPLTDKGVLKELFVVLPSERPLGPGSLEGIRLSLAGEGVPPSDLDTLAFDNGVIRGRIRGVPFAVSALTGVPVGRRPCSVVIDTFFLLGVYKSEVSMPMVDLAGKLFVTLGSRGVDATSVVVLDGTPRADFPLEHGELAMMIREMAASPKEFSDALPEKWRLRKRADRLYFFMQGEEASGLYREWNALEPRDGSAAYRIALTAARGLDADLALRWLDTAASADSAYSRGYLEIARIFKARQQSGAAERILGDGSAKFPKDGMLATALAELYVALGDEASGRGAATDAMEYYRKAALLEGADDRVRSEAESRSNPARPLRPGRKN